MAAYCSCRDAFLPGPSSGFRQGSRPGAFVVSHLGSVMPAVCLTRPQYVLRSYCDSGSSRLPGREADIFGAGAWGGASCLEMGVMVSQPLLVRRGRIEDRHWCVG